MHIPILSIVGVGLMGGSIALAARQRGLVDRIVGCDRNEEFLTWARRHGMLDEAASDPCVAVRDASLVVICTDGR